MNRLARVSLFSAFALASGIHSPNFAHAETKDQIAVKVDADDRMTITVNVGDKEIPAVLDTAATYFMIDHNVLNEFNSQPMDSAVDILGMDGLENYPTAEVGPLRAGNTDLGTHPAAINARKRFIGHRTIVPANALPGRSLDFDFAGGTIEISDKRPKQPRKNLVSRIRYDEQNGLVFIPVLLNGKRGQALVDTGSDVTYVNSAFVSTSGATPQPEKTRRLFGTASEGVTVNVFSARSFKVGDHTMQQFDILAADPPLFDHLGLSEEPVMVMGLDFLREFRLQIDRERKIILLGRRPEPGSARHIRISPQQGRVPRE